MWIPATAALVVRARTGALPANCAKDDVMSVGRQRVTPVARIRSSASTARSASRSGALKSIPPKPFTWRSNSPGSSILMTDDARDDVGLPVCAAGVLVYLAVFHHKHDAPQRCDVLQRIAVDGDEIGVQAGRERSDPIAHAERLCVE